jgi:cell division transport system permease protein
MAKGRPIRRRSRSRLLNWPRAWLSHHLQGALGTLGRLFRRPLPTLMTVSVVGIALALPGGLYVLTRNLNLLGNGWDQTATISVFLHADVDIEAAGELAAELRKRPDLAEVQLIEPDDALAELRGQSGFAEAIDQLDHNPLPVVLALRPSDRVTSPDALELLRDELNAISQADFARVDTEWIRRFQAIVSLVQRGVLLLAGVLSIAVLLVVGNTIRLEIENRRSEIEIMELVGATSAFIRRPFLYMGAWYGLLGGVTAWLLVTFALTLLQGPVSRLASLYKMEFPLSGLGFGAVIALFGASAGLGLLGSWLSVGRHLSACEPR